MTAVQAPIPTRVRIVASRRLSATVVLLYAAVLLGVEVATAWLSVEAALASYAALLLVLVTHVALMFGEGSEIQRALTRLALIPVLKVGAIALPQEAIRDVYWHALPAVLALATLFALRAVEGSPSAKRRPSSHGWPVQLGIAATGPVLAVAAAFVLAAAQPTTPAPAFALAPANVLAVAALLGIALESVFRGALQPALMRVFGWPAPALVSVAYAALFFDSRSAFVILLALGTGLIWGVLAAITRGASGVAMSHALFAMTWASLF